MTDTVDYASNLAHFLMCNAGGIFGTWRGRMTANDQRTLFGRFLGKGRIVINGKTETISHIRKIAFGLDSDVTKIKWREL